MEMVKNRLVQDRSAYELIMVEDPFLSEDSLNLASQISNLILEQEHTGAAVSVQQRIIQPYLAFVNSFGTTDAMQKIHIAGFSSILTKPVY